MKIYETSGFVYAYIRSPKHMSGTVYPFKPFWWVQNLGDGLQEYFDTKEQCLQWIKEWDAIDA
jgi:hypothetical protein